MKGLFIPGITEKIFRNASVESVAELMADGKIYDIDYIVVDGCRRCSMDKTITEILEEVKKSMCDDYCKYPNMKNDNENWLFEKGSPCETCPLNRL